MSTPTNATLVKIEVECPNGCQPGGKPGTICFACYGKGWVEASVAEDIRRKREKQALSIVTITTRQIAFDEADDYP